MTFHEMIKTAEKLVADNSPAILTAIGVTGTVVTAVLTGKAVLKADKILEFERLSPEHKRQIEPLPKISRTEEIKLVWQEFIPPVVVGSTTIACIICANRIGTRRTAAMAAVYSLSEKAFAEYKDKIIETVGKNKEQKVRDDVAQDRVTQNPVTTREVIITGNGDVLCYDDITGRYFHSNVESLRKAQNDINEEILNNMYASLFEFYELIGLAPTKYSGEVGWNLDNLLELEFSTTLAEDNRPCISVNYRVYPIRNYARLQ